MWSTLIEHNICHWNIVHNVSPIFATMLPCGFRRKPNERYRERNRETRNNKKKTEEKEAIRDGVPRACFRDDATGGTWSTTGTSFLEPVIWNLHREVSRTPLRYAHRKGDEKERERERGIRGERTITSAPLFWPQSTSLHILARQCSKLPRNSPCNHRRSQTFSGSDNAGGRCRRVGTTMRSLQNAGHRDFSQGSVNQHIPSHIGGEHLTRLTRRSTWTAFVISEDA